MNFTSTVYIFLYETGFKIAITSKIIQICQISAVILFNKYKFISSTSVAEKSEHLMAKLVCRKYDT